MKKIIAAAVFTLAFSGASFAGEPVVLQTDQLSSVTGAGGWGWGWGHYGGGSSATAFSEANASGRYTMTDTFTSAWAGRHGSSSVSGAAACSGRGC